MLHFRIFALMTTVLVGFAAATDYGCQVVGPNRGQCHDVGLNGAVKCYPKGTGNFRVSGGAFSPTDFVHMCLGDGGKTCADASNTAAILSDGSNSCCSCFLYARYCNGKSGTVTNNKNLYTDDEVLVMPAAPCTGVEYWGRGQCPGEQIWSEAFAKLPGGPEYGMAINPVSKRGQHQMHIHLAKIEPTLVNKVHAGFGTFIKGNVKTFCIDCGGGRSLASCTKAYADSGNGCGRDLQVTIKESAKTAADAAPFVTVYPAADRAAQRDKAALVFRLHKNAKPDTWAIVTHTAGPAECFFTTTAKKCG